ITEAVNIGRMSNAFERAPGIWTDEQVEGWKPIVDHVHDKGGRIVAQLWHGGRASARGIRDPDPGATYGHLAQWHDRAGLAYLHIADTNAWSGSPDYDRLIPLIR